MAEPGLLNQGFLPLSPMRSVGCLSKSVQILKISILSSFSEKSSNGFPLFSLMIAMQTLMYMETDSLFELSKTQKERH